MKGLALTASFILVSMGGITSAAKAATPGENLRKSADVFSEIMSAPDKGIPQDLLDKAQCVVLVPDLYKGAFVVGGEWGHGFAVCRNANGAGWGAPAAMKLEGGSVGFQLGGSDTQLVLLVMNREGMDKLMSDKITLGADASVAAGPVGRNASAQTDLKLSAEMLAWSRSKGVFAGVALKGATLRPDNGANEKLYGRAMGTREILMGNVHHPEAARPLVAALDRYSGRHGEASRVDR